MCKKKCCMIGIIVATVLFVVAVVVVALAVVKKVHMLRHRTMDEGYWPDEEPQKVEDTGVRYTTDQDFV